MTVLQKRVLEDVRRRVLEVAGGMSDQHMAAMFGAFDTNNDHRISIHEFVDGLSRTWLSHTLSVVRESQRTDSLTAK